MAPYLTQPDLHAQAEYRAALLTYPANLRQALKDAASDPAKTLFGVGQGIPCAAVSKVLVSPKPGFLWLDAEHSPIGRQELYDAIQAANHHSEGHTAVIVRVGKHDDVSLTTALDAGAAGIVIPHTESAEDVKRFVKEAYYPPLGQRSFSPWTFTPGVSDQSLYERDPFNVATSNKHVVLVPQVESVLGVEKLEEIAAVPGIGALMFGPGDFMLDAGIELKLGGEPDPKFLAAIGKLATVAKKHNIPLMIGARTNDEIPGLIAGGFRVIGIYMDVWNISMAIAGNLAAGKKYAEEAGQQAKSQSVGRETVTVNGKA